MELSTNSKCQLILDGSKPDGLEVIVYNNKYTIIERKDNKDTFYFDMPEDGLFQYFVLEFEEEPEDILEYIQDESICPEKEIFSICKLRNCLLNKEKDYISKFLHGCNTNISCKNSDAEDITRDFLLSTVFVLEHLICSGQTTEAVRILNNIQNCTLCSDIKSTNNCGCNEKYKQTLSR